MPATDPATLAADCARDLIDALRPSMAALGTDMRDEMRELISVPVGHVNGRIIRSRQGEAPRMETKQLRASMTSDVAVEGAEITARMGSDEAVADYSKYLEGNLSRPHFSTIYERVQNYAVDRILSRLPQTI